jgi:fructokinase
MPDVIACGEMLIDFVSTASGVTLAESPAFEKAPGGAPANVAVGLSRLGLTSGFMGKVGDDPFGYFLRQTLLDNSVDVSQLRLSTEARTGLAFVSLRPDGERDFLFYRNPSADMFFAPEDVDAGWLATAKAFHFGSISLGAEPSRSATLHALQMAQEMGLFISYDPNLRLNLWPSARAARDAIMLGWPYANVVKISEEELTFLTGVTDMEDLESGLMDLWHDRLRLIVITQGAAGCAYATPKRQGHAPGFSVKVVDTTGAGDAFLAALLYRLYPDSDRLMQGKLRRPQIEAAIRFANAAGALATTRRGAIPALPILPEVEALLTPPV